MLYFSSDYQQACHPEILRRIAETNYEGNSGYGTDEHCRIAKEKIKAACGTPDAEIFFIPGGTQTNMLVLDTILAPYEAVISAETGHIQGHEAGAVEFTGHKILTIPGYEGKIKATDLRARLRAYADDDNREHTTPTGAVYISFPTEYGTIYSKSELTEIYGICREYGIPLFIDGARLGYGLMSPECDLTLPELAHLCDVFYIGGTKMGALMGEAVVFTHANMPKHFFTSVKQHGALLAKGWLLGIQFETLFTDDLYFKLGKNAIDCAMRVKELLIEKGYKLHLDSPTNQQFAVVEDSLLPKLAEHISYGFWEKPDATHTVIRFATGWATRPEDVDELAKYL